MGKISRIKQRKQTQKKREGVMGIRRKTVNHVIKDNIDTSVNMDKKIAFQNDETSAPVTPKSASLILKEKKLSGYRMIDINSNAYVPYANMEL